jgi:hypothetical protein
MSEPYGKSIIKREQGQQGQEPSSSLIHQLPQMLEKYSSIYNKNGRIGIYTREERDSIIHRFYEKRKKRVWKKRIRYHCRKNLADSRVRVKGRFVKNQADEDDEDDDDSQDEEEKMKDALVALLQASQLPFNSATYKMELDLASLSSAKPTRSSKRPAAETITPSFARTRVKEESRHRRPGSPPEAVADEIREQPPVEEEEDLSPTSSIAESVRRRKRMRRHSIAY